MLNTFLQVYIYSSARRRLLRESATGTISVKIKKCFVDYGLTRSIETKETIAATTPDAIIKVLVKISSGAHLAYPHRRSKPSVHFLLLFHHELLNSYIFFGREKLHHF
mmetsp:Transcript_18330/g.22743  ORF Transcript_18330/g.22743 Transcript_18330/m.22743 type:complete len:108 (-) Transcript_18330:2727-3050(-)